MSQPKVYHGAIALIKSGGRYIGKMKSVRATENFRRVEIVGIGTILPSEAPVTGWAGTVSCSAMTMQFTKGVLPNAVRRNFTNIGSQALAGNPSFEDNVVLDSDGIDLELYEKVTDVIDPVTGAIKPKVVPHAIIRKVLIESDSLDISEGAVSGHDQSFKFLLPIIDN